MSRPRPSPRGLSPDLDTPPRHFDTRRSFLAPLLSTSPRRLLDQRLSGSAGRVVPRDEGAGRVSRPRPSPRERSPDLDTAARSSSATRSAKLRSRWSSSAPRRRSRARVETSTKSPRTLTGSRHGSSFLAAYSISGCVGSAGRVVPRDEGAGHVSRPRPGPRGLSPDLDTPPRSSSATRSAVGSCRWSSSAPRRRSRARVETSTKSPRTLARSRHASSFLVGYSISETQVSLVE